MAEKNTFPKSTVINEADDKPSTITCNLRNSLRATRIIYDGIAGSMKAIHVRPGETKKSVTISREIADELRARNRAKKGSELDVLPLTEDEPAAA